MASGICIDCGSDLPSRVGKRCKPCSADDYDKRHTRGGGKTAREYIVALLSNCSECSLKEMVRLLPSTEHAIEGALNKMSREGIIRRTAWGVYALRPEGAKVAPPPAVVRGPFITPIPKHRLMAGRA